MAEISEGISINYRIKYYPLAENSVSDFRLGSHRNLIPPSRSACASAKASATRGRWTGKYSLIPRSFRER